MADMETVITHLQIIHTWAEFARERDLQFFTAKHLEDIAKWSDDAISLLKEQEAVDKNTGEWKNGHCSCCGEDVSSMLDTWTNVQNFLFCPNCGAKMEGR